MQLRVMHLTPPSPVSSLDEEEIEEMPLPYQIGVSRPPTPFPTAGNWLEEGTLRQRLNNQQCWACGNVCTHTVSECPAQNQGQRIRVQTSDGPSLTYRIMEQQQQLEQEFRDWEPIEPESDADAIVEEQQLNLAPRAEDCLAFRRMQCKEDNCLYHKQ
ncbi:hypothetical protein M501DRAFT_667636 [Patellaria atrata CBS 101060]|uniref:Uncharacterized protein n=1 Tax=Patellaria atrata CBS 101060 TaxID=1346257 RepID=A0A9P4S2U4_9PEZI|nr:hypothetical protein M501DRAFT_667636 [Patellaria atrata CBS 101060]